MKISQNIARLEYLLSLYRFSKEDFLAEINEGRKRKFTFDHFFSKEIKLAHLKKIDEIFEKGINFYTNPRPLTPRKEASIFFRKEKFDVDLNLAAKQLVNKYEDFKITLSAIAKMTDTPFERLLPIYTINDNVKTIAIEMRRILFPKEKKLTTRKFLSELISNLASYGILVFEFIEYWNQTKRANIDGLFMSPNVIVLKRHQDALKREAFTLAHELAHCLLNEETIEQIDNKETFKGNINQIEHWCNDFAYYFLAGELDISINEISFCNYNNNYNRHIVEQISKSIHLSTHAIYTRLFILKKISWKDYEAILQIFKEEFKERERIKQEKKDLDKLAGKKQGGLAPVPIVSPLFISSIRRAFYEGVMNEYDLSTTFDLPSKRLKEYIE